MSSIPTIVIYHGNCPDGFAAYSLYRKWALAFGPVTGYPVAPQDERTWPAIPPSPFSVAFLDVVPDEAALLRWEAAAVKTTVIDHHASSKDTLLTSGHFPQKKDQVVQFSTECCAAVLTHKYLYPLVPVPDWLWHVDRVDRWSGVTAHDVALREYLQPLARMPVAGAEAAALAQLDTFIADYSAGGIKMLEILAESDKRLVAKQKKLDAILSNPRRTNRIRVDADYCENTGLDVNWIDQVVLSVVTTGTYGFDSTLASHLVFTKCPDVTVFVNYIEIGKFKYKYCVRSKGFDVTEGIGLDGKGFFFGHPCAAGGVLGGPTSPFLV